MYLSNLYLHTCAKGLALCCLYLCTTVVLVSQDLYLVNLYRCLRLKGLACIACIFEPAVNLCQELACVPLTNTRKLLKREKLNGITTDLPPIPKAFLGGQEGDHCQDDLCKQRSPEPATQPLCYEPRLCTCLIWIALPSSIQVSTFTRQTLCLCLSTALHPRMCH